MKYLNGEGFKRNLISLAVVAATTGTLSFQTVAQEDTRAQDETEVITVKGFRGSQIAAKDLKRNALVAQDSIVAEDIADFPDLNLADSLQRVPGVVITREGGEGRQISLRGLGPDFTRVQVNGMEALGISTSPMDSRGAVSRSRAFDFNIFASELFNQIDVKKSYSANQEEGGMGGTVELHTARPFDYEGFQSVVSLQGGTNSNTDSTDPRFAGLISNTWGDFGALASVAFSKRQSAEESYNTYRWRQRARSNSIDPDTGDEIFDNISENIDAETKTLIENGELWFARGNRYSVWETDQERLGITVALQYKASDELDFSLDFLHGKLSNVSTEHHISTGGSSSTALGKIEELQWIDNDGDKEVVYGRFSGLSIRTENREDHNESTFNQVTFKTNWQVNDDLKMTAQIGTSSSDFDQPKLDKANIQNHNNEIITDFTQDRFYAVNTYDFDTASIDGWEVRDLYFREDYMTTDFDNAKVDFDYVINNESSLTFGANYKKFTNTSERRESSGYPTNGKTPLNADDRTIPVEAQSLFTGHPELNWVQADIDALQAHYGVYDLKLTEDDITANTQSRIEETTKAAYAQYDWSGELADSPLRLSAGLRYYSTNLETEGVLPDDSNTVSVVSRSYSGVLPSLNIVYEINDDLLWRFGASKNLTRPSLNDLSIIANVRQNALDGPDDIGGVRQGNPYLEPYESNNLDMSLEWYFDEVGLLSGGVFYKTIDKYIVAETEQYAYGELGLPLDLLPPGGTANTIYDLTIPRNTEDTKIKGLELAFQRDFDFLPEPFNNLGMIANYTWVDGESLYKNVQGTGQDQVKSFPGLSETSYNLTFYYETETWGARIAAAHRSDYISVVEGGLGDEDERGFHATTFVDFSAFYQVSEKLKVNFEGINLTDEREEQYSDSSDRAYNTTNAGRTFMVGLTYKF